MAQGFGLSQDLSPSITAVTSGYTPAPLTIVIEWFKTLPKLARAGLSLENLHNLSKQFDAARENERGVPPPGWVLVPREPTAEMLDAAEGALACWRKSLTRDEAMARSYQAADRRFIASATPAEKHAIRYRAMIEAAQSRSHSLSGRQGNTSVAHAPRDTPEPSSPPEDELSKLSGGWEPIDGDVVRDIAGETVRGFRVAAYRETHPEHGDAYGHRYSEHWSTPSQDPRVKIERLFTEAQLLVALGLPALPQDHAPVRGREGSEFGQTSSSTHCADAQARPTGGDLCPLCGDHRQVYCRLERCPMPRGAA